MIFSHPFGTEQGRRAREDALEGINKEAGMRPCGRTGARSCPGSVLVHVPRGSSVLLQR